MKRLHKAFWFWLHQQATNRLVRYEMDNLTDYGFLDRVSADEFGE